MKDPLSTEQKVEAFMFSICSMLLLVAGGFLVGKDRASESVIPLALGVIGIWSTRR